MSHKPAHSKLPDWGLPYMRARELLDYDADTGDFRWRVTRSNRVKAGAIAGTVKRDGYVQICIDSRPIAGHRLAWLYVFGEWPIEELDHLNGNRSDNRLANLRDVARGVNAQNRQGAMSNSSCGVLGVSWRACYKHWRVSVVIYGVQREIGTFKSLDDARNASINARREHYKGFLL